MDLQARQTAGWPTGLGRAVDTPQHWPSGRAGKGHFGGALAQRHRCLMDSPAQLLGQLLALGLAAGLCRNADPQGSWLGWFSACLCVWCVRMAWCLCLLRGRPSSRDGASWEIGDRRLLLLQGLVTGLACAAFQPQASGLEQALLLLVVFADSLAALPVLAPGWRWFVAHLAFTAGPMAWRVVLDVLHPSHLHLIAAVAVLNALVVCLALQWRRMLRDLQRRSRRVARLRRHLADQAALVDFAQVAQQARQQACADWMAAAAHDLGQPLMAARLYAQSLAHGPLDPAQRLACAGLEQSLQAAEMLIGDLLELSRREGVSPPVRLQPLQLKQVYERLEPQVGPLAFDRGLSIRWRGGSRRVWGDPMLLERCLRNLILNAIAHTDGGGILVGARRRGDALVLQVWDTGNGISPSARAVLERVGPQPAASSRGGWGLGLGIVRRLSHLMGARIATRSRIGNGSLIELVFPDPAEA